MKKIIGITSTVISGLIIFAILFVLVMGLPAFSFASGRTTENDYSNIMKANITGNPHVVDIAMLGAHDAFTNAINTKSRIDPAEGKDSQLNNKYLMTFTHGLSVRMTRAQKSSAADLLKHGVRYFDVRLTYMEKEDAWYVKHGYLSDKLEVYLSQMIEFLHGNDGEIVIFDIQHVYYNGSNLGDLMDYIGLVRNGNISLFSFLHYSPSDRPLPQLTYNDVTENGTKSGVVILAKGITSRGNQYYSYDDSMRSVWHEVNTTGALFDAIDKEYRKLEDDKFLDRGKFRVNQAVKTGIYGGFDIVPTVFGWSLLDMAAKFNIKAVNHKDFEKWLEVMPIFMVDNADSMRGGFNDKVISKINAYNQKLI